MFNRGNSTHDRWPRHSWQRSYLLHERQRPIWWSGACAGLQFAVLDAAKTSFEYCCHVQHLLDLKMNILLCAKVNSTKKILIVLLSYTYITLFWVDIFKNIFYNFYLSTLGHTKNRTFENWKFSASKWPILVYFDSWKYRVNNWDWGRGGGFTQSACFKSCWMAGALVLW